MEAASEGFKEIRPVGNCIGSSETKISRRLEADCVAILISKERNLIRGKGHLAVDGVGSGEGPGEHQAQQVLVAHTLDSELVLELLKVKHLLNVDPFPWQALVSCDVFFSFLSPAYLKRRSVFICISKASQFLFQNCTFLFLFSAFLFSSLMVTSFPFSISLSSLSSFLLLILF